MKSSTRDKFQRHLISRALLGEFSETEIGEIAAAFTTPNNATLMELGNSLNEVLRLLFPSSRKKQDFSHEPSPPPTMSSILAIIKNYQVPLDSIFHMLSRVSDRHVRLPKRLSGAETADYLEHVIYSLSEQEREQFARLFSKEILGPYQEDLYLNLITKKSASSNVSK